MTTTPEQHTRMQQALKEAPEHVGMVSLCKHCDSVIDFITESWVKRLTDGIYCDANPKGRPGLAGFEWGKHEPLGPESRYIVSNTKEPVKLMSDMHINDKASVDKFLNVDYSKVELRLMSYMMSDQHFFRGAWRTMKTTLENVGGLYSISVENVEPENVPKIQAAVQHAAFGVAPHLAPIPEGKYLLTHAEMDFAARQLAERSDRISAIRLVRACTGWGLKEAKDYVEGLTGVRHG